MSKHVAHIDFETRSACDLKKAGVHRYAEDPTTEIICLAYRIGAGDVKTWEPGQPDPVDLLHHVWSGRTVVAHNMQFDRTIWNRKMWSRLWPKIDIWQTDCTMARASAMGLPASLDMLGRAIALPIPKDKDGHRLMMQMCKPRKVHQDGKIEWWDDAERRAALLRYCATDILAESAVDDILPPLSEMEQKLYHLDQTINDRGVAVDLNLAHAALEVVQVARTKANERMWVLTDGAVTACSQTARLVAWLNARGIQCESVAKGDIEEIVITSEILGDEIAQEAIELRRATAKTSTDKFKAMINSACADSRVRGTLAYHSAHTGRWAGRLIQPQNFPRVDPDRDLPNVTTALDILPRGLSGEEAYCALDMLTGDVMGTLSKCLRAAIVAGPNKRFVGGDFSNIEGRLNAWIAGEDWKLDAFRDYDAGTGPDLYKLAFSRSFDVSVERVSKADRQIGKVMELALGYQGGAGAFLTMAANYGVRVSEERANELKAAWRAANPRITQSWWEMQDAAIAAVGSPNEKITILGGKVVFLMKGGFLYCRLPSKRVIAFAHPRLVVTEDKLGRKRYQVEYEGLDSQTKKWGPQRLYGGNICNNIVQGTARDIMAEAMLRVEKAGYHVVLTVHDELLAEIDNTMPPREQEFAALMSVLPDWAAGLPLATAAWEDTRYVK